MTCCYWHGQRGLSSLTKEGNLVKECRLIGLVVVQALNQVLAGMHYDLGGQWDTNRTGWPHTRPPPDFVNPKREGACVMG